MERKDYITDELVVKRAKAAVEIELEKRKAMDAPIVTFDRKEQVIYQENSDGSRVVVGTRIRKERYSERIAKKA